MRLIPRLTAVAAAFALAAVPLAAQKAAAAKAQEYQVEFAFPNNAPYVGTMTLTIAQGKVAGKMAIERPETITGSVAGTLKAAALSLDYPYEMAGDKPCTGRVTVNATFNAARTQAKGTTHAEGCGNPIDGQFTLTKSSK